MTAEAAAVGVASLLLETVILLSAVAFMEDEEVEEVVPLVNSLSK